MKVDSKQYAKLIFELVRDKGEGEIDGAISGVVALMKKRGDINKSGKVIECLEVLLNEKDGIKDIQIISSRELGKEEILEVKKSLALKFETDPEKININFKIDENLGGGMIVKMGDIVWDGSVKKKLENLKEKLLA